MTPTSGIAASMISEIKKDAISTAIEKNKTVALNFIPVTHSAENRRKHNFTKYEFSVVRFM